MAELRLEEVQYQYQKTGQQVLKGVSCCFEGGQLCAVIGPSGSGKTTLLSLMAGLDRPTIGELFVDGEPLSRMDFDCYRRERISMIFQSFQLFPLLSILENVCYPMELKGETKKEAEKRAKELLELIGITKEKHKRFPSQLSGGEQQRVAIARALSSGARILLADEPTGNLDEENTGHIFRILQDLAHQQGYCVVVVTHDLQAAELADRILQMKAGQLIEQKSSRCTRSICSGSST